MTRVKGGIVSKNRRRKVLKELKVILEANIDYIRLLKNNYFIVELIVTMIERKELMTLENYGLQELTQLVEQMI